MAIKRVFLLLATSFEINILHHWCTIPCVIETQRYGYIRDSGGSVETPYGKITGCEKSQNDYKEGVFTVGDFFSDKYTKYFTSILV